MSKNLRKKRIGRASAGNSRSHTRQRDTLAEHRAAKWGGGFQALDKACKQWLREKGVKLPGHRDGFTFGSRDGRKVAGVEMTVEALERTWFQETAEDVAQELGWVTGRS